MAGTKINIFSGLVPRLPESLLPERKATIAHNCDFAYGELRNTKGGYLVNTMVNQPLSIYTDDGLTFFTWTADVNAVRSPIAKDTFQRMYYTDGSTMRVADRRLAQISGGPPGASYRVGVPRATVAPRLTVSIPDIKDGTKYTLTFRFHYEYGGVKYQEGNIAVTNLSSTQSRFTPPALQKQDSFNTKDDFPAEGVAGTIYEAQDTSERFTWNGTAYVTTTNTGTPTSAFPVIRMTAKEITTSAEVCDVYSDNSSFPSTGGLWTIALIKDENADTYTLTLSTGVKEADKETRAYVYTYVNTYGEEGPPSPPALVSTHPLASIGITVTLDTVTDYAPIKEIRFYRTPTGSSIAEYFYVGFKTVLSSPPGEYSDTDSVRGEGLNDPLASTNYYPPEAGLIGLMTLPNGILCAWKGNELWFSEAYKPHAWPPAYVKPLPHTIVGGVAHGTGAIVTTVAQPYLVEGVSADSMTTSRLNVDQAGVSKWSIAVVDGAVLYASHDGLVAITGGGATLDPGQRFFTRDVWRQRYGVALSSMRFSVWDGRLIVFSTTNNMIPFMVRVDETDGTLTDLPGFLAQAAFVSLLSDQCYYAYGNGIYQFNGGLELTAVWQSRELVLAKPVNFGYAQTVAEGSWSVEFYADGALKHTEAVSSGVSNFRLPSGFKSDRWKIKITGAGRFRELRIAETGRGLAAL